MIGGLVKMFLKILILDFYGSIWDGIWSVGNLVSVGGGPS